MKNEKRDLNVYLNKIALKKKVLLELAATAMLANLKLRKQKP